MPVDILVEQQVGLAGSTLGGLSALALELGHEATNLVRAFLMKKMRVCYSASGIASGDNVMLVLSRGNISVAELSVAMGSETVSPGDDYQRHQGTVRRVVDQVMVPNTGGATGTHALGFTWDVDLPSKGIPFAENEGWFISVVNPQNAAWTTGSLHSVTSRIWGVWL